MQTIIPFEGFRWVFEIKERIDVEYVVEQRMKAAAFHVRMGTAFDMAPTPRAVKDALLRKDIVI